MKYYRYVQQQIPLVVFIPCHCCGCTVRSIICLFSANLNGICPFHMKGRVSLTVPWTTYNTRELLPNNIQNFINVHKSVLEKLPCSISKSVAKQQLTSQRHCTFVTAAMMPLALMIWVHSAATIHNFWNDLHKYMNWFWNTDKTPIIWFCFGVVHCKWKLC